MSRNERINANKAPLRKIVGHDKLGREVLECGHVQYPITFGPPNVIRRRCGRCLREQLEQAAKENVPTYEELMDERYGGLEDEVDYEADEDE